MGNLSHTRPDKVPQLSQERGQKDCKRWEWSACQWSIIAWMWHGQSHNNSQRLWLHSQDLQDIKSAKIPAWTCEIPFLDERILTSNGCWKRQSQFSSGIWPSKDYPCFSGWSTSMCIPLSRLHMFKTKGHKKLGRESVRGGEGRNWGRWMKRRKNGGVDFTETYHMHIRSSIFKRCKITIETLANRFKKKERKLFIPILENEVYKIAEMSVTLFSFFSLLNQNDLPGSH